MTEEQKREAKLMLNTGVYETNSDSNLLIVEKSYSTTTWGITPQPKSLEHYYEPKEDVSSFELAVLIKYINNPNTFPSRVEDVKLPIFRHFRIPALEFKPFIAYKVVNKERKSNCSKREYKVGETIKVEGDLIPSRNGIRFRKNVPDINSSDILLEIEVLEPYIADLEWGLTSKIRVIRELSRVNIANLKNPELESIKNSIKPVLEFAKKHNLVIGGSISLMLQGIIPYRKFKDADFVCIDDRDNKALCEQLKVDEKEEVQFVDLGYESSAVLLSHSNDDFKYDIFKGHNYQKLVHFKNYLLNDFREVLQAKIHYVCVSTNQETKDKHLADIKWIDSYMRDNNVVL